MLYIVNHLSIPTSWTHSYSLFGGVQDALVQWWYGHNAVAFFLTTPILGIMYYFLPKAAERPVYSYRLRSSTSGRSSSSTSGRAPPPAQHGAARTGCRRSG
jgi:cbb3-type cytochrome oxidase subunit 1